MHDFIDLYETINALFIVHSKLAFIFNENITQDRKNVQSPPEALFHR